ncbi:MAG: hypothetical protein A2849_02795 [Candidatus Taylorbacteria bacterium RIFCSPHIGHO2_01_FULL_51_15]|uniref:DoxX subfamily n=1 Tax=Candidatus Taylorbacteria bacterium RIFCSPHIGHO2_01_FULL_51_15 TaxID=1802304 RepID=A0A1G2MFQ0_9BACT|nr:MAG: hypothetical protein A2849_02795 [Candidatus Taylorbacteria bacterium RIFCSPHIGHO2_01_FULL_51_15]
MGNPQRVFLFLFRVSIGWLFFYAGLSKVFDPSWSAAGYLNAAKTFSSFYAWLASPAMLPFTNFINEWGLTLIGLSLILGAFIRYGAIAGALLMLLYYFPILHGAYPNPHSFIVDEHIIYIFALLTLATSRKRAMWSIDGLRNRASSAGNS